MMKKFVNILIFGLISFFTSLTLADVPVVDYSLDANFNKDIGTPKPAESFKPSIGPKLSDSIKFPVPIATAGLNSEQRINKLEQQINNINEQNLLSKINELQERLQKLNGQIEDQVHQIEQLNTQVRDFYQDLNQRLDKSKNVETKKPLVEANKVTAQNVNNVSVTTEGAVKALPDINSSSSQKNNADDVGQHKSDKAFLQEQQMYQTAIDLLPDKKYEASESKLRDYLKHYPKGVYVANAHYWLGEINFLQKNYDAAEEEFKIVVTKYAKSKRVSDANFKLALVHQNQGRDVQAKEELKKVIKRYPNTSAAQLAKLQLDGN